MSNELKRNTVSSISFIECIENIHKNVTKRLKEITIKEEMPEINSLAYCVAQLDSAIWFLNEYMKHFDKKGYLKVEYKDE